MAVNDQMQSTVNYLNGSQQQQQQPDPNAALLAILQAILSRPQPQPQQPDFAGIFGAMRNDPQGDANKGYVPGLPSEYNPFTNGFFGSGPVSSVQSGQPQAGIPPRTDAGSNPYAFGAVGTAGPPMTPQYNMPPPMPTGPMQGMINPMLPDALKYQDANMFGVSPFTSLQPGQTMGDEKGAYIPPAPKKKKPGNFGAGGGKSFMFGAGTR